MTNRQLQEIVSFIEGRTDEVSVSCKTLKEGKAFYEVLSESRSLYQKLHQKGASLDAVIDQIQLKNTKAQQYYEISGEKWLF